MPTIALAPSMGTVLHFNHITPCSERLFANFSKILVAVVAVTVGIFQCVPCQESEHMRSAELVANVTGNHCQDQSFHRIESRSKAHHEDWLKVLFSMVQPLAHAGPQPADIYRWRQNGYNLLYVTTNMFLKTSVGAIAQFPPLGCEPDNTSLLQWNIGQW